MNLCNEYSFLKKEVVKIGGSKNLIKKEMFFVLQCLLLSINNNFDILIYKRTKKEYYKIEY